MRECIRHALSGSDGRAVLDPRHARLLGIECPKRAIPARAGARRPFGTRDVHPTVRVRRQGRHDDDPAHDIQRAHVVRRRRTPAPPACRTKLTET